VNIRCVEELILGNWRIEVHRITETCFATMFAMRFGEMKHGKLSKETILLHDSSRPHVENLTKTTLATMYWEIMNCPPTELTTVICFNQ
jgi:hypothetical protein